MLNINIVLPRLIVIVVELKGEYFPQYLSLIITNVQSILSFPTSSSIADLENLMSKLYYYKKIIKKQFISFSVTFHNNDIQITTPEVLKHELFVYVRTFPDYFEKFNINN